MLTLDGIQDAFQQQLACCSCALTCLPAVVSGNVEVPALAMRCLHITAHTLRAPPSSVGFQARDFLFLSPMKKSMKQ